MAILKVCENRHQMRLRFESHCKAEGCSLSRRTITKDIHVCGVELWHIRKTQLLCCFTVSHILGTKPAHICVVTNMTQISLTGMLKIQVFPTIPKLSCTPFPDKLLSSFFLCLPCRMPVMEKPTRRLRYFFAI